MFRGWWLIWICLHGNPTRITHKTKAVILQMSRWLRPTYLFHSWHQSILDHRRICICLAYLDTDHLHMDHSHIHFHLHNCIILTISLLQSFGLNAHNNLGTENVLSSTFRRYQLTHELGTKKGKRYFDHGTTEVRNCILRHLRGIG